MKRISILICIILSAALLLSACSTVGALTGKTGLSAPSAQDVSVDVLDDPVSQDKETQGAFALLADQASSVSTEGSVYTITAGGEYTLTGRLDEGRVIVNAGEEDEVKLILDGASITSSSGAPIAFVQAGKATVSSAEGSYNTVYDARTAVASDTENQDGAIYAVCDLQISGKGTLIVTSDCDNGIKTKDDLTVKNVTMKVTAPGNALKGNDSVTVQSGNLILISTASDGVKTSNTDLSSKGNRRGTVAITGGHVDIYAACDGISAAYNAEIAQEETCVVNIYTSSYANTSDPSAVAGSLYLVVPASLYSERSDYYAYYYNGSDAGVWVQFTYDGMVGNGRKASYYGLKGKIPSGYQSVRFASFPVGTAPESGDPAASTAGETLNTSMNGFLITSSSGGAFSGDWVQLTSGSGNSDKTAYSSKGIKAENEVIIRGGTVTVFSMDDGLHANNDGQLESGASPLGNITVTGGSLTVTAADDGLHADGVLTVSGGAVQVVKSHEGLEGNVIRISGGSVTVYADDDGLNACAGAQTPLIDLAGGTLDVTTPSGDTDAVDSNGNFTMSGGFALIKGGAATGNMAGSVDVDGTVTVTGGTVVALGGICETPSNGSVNTYISSGTSFSAGAYTLAASDGTVLCSFTRTGSYSSCWIASDALALNGTYTLSKDGSSLLTWTQTSSTVGSAGNQGGFGGFGGGPGGMGGGGGRPGRP